jgi:hypothetical protein
MMAVPIPYSQFLTLNWAYQPFLGCGSEETKKFFWK